MVSLLPLSQKMPLTSLSLMVTVLLFVISMEALPLNRRIPAFQ